jgi:nucleoside-diphosphate-sugar epimerase
MSTLLCIGLGYTARFFAARIASEGWRIIGTAQSEDGAARIASLGYEAIIFDGTAPSEALRIALASATHVLISAPPDAAGDPLLRHHADDLPTALSWIGYLSTVGVYGDHGGAWVDETTVPKPVSNRSRWRLTAEQTWLDLAKRSGIRVEIFRLAGIYGPGRGPLESVRNGTARAIVKPGQVFNRIHVEDIAQAIEACVMHNADGAFNVTDDEPTPPGVPIAFAAELLGVEAPAEIPFAEAAKTMTPMGLSFYGESKRVRNARLKGQLGVALRYPTYREGLRALLARES